MVHEQDLLDFFQPEWTESAPILEFDASQYMQLMDLEGDDFRVLYGFLDAVDVVRALGRPDGQPYGCPGMPW